MPYCVGTSGWLDGWERQYPPDVFPTLWTKLEELIDAEEIISNEEATSNFRKKQMSFTPG